MAKISLRVLQVGGVRRVLARLQESGRGEVRLSRHDRMLYATDASLYQVEPVAVVIPASVSDAEDVVRICAEGGVAMLPRGGGTSLAGQCTNDAVVLDFSARCTRILELDAAARRVRVECGITVDDLNDAIAGSGLFFAPDPATSRHANIGGCIGNNAAGSRSIRYGRTSESVEAIDACLSDGTRVRIGRGTAREQPRLMAITRGVVDVVQRHEGLIRERFPKTVRRNAGYGLDMILQQLDAGVAPEDVSLAPFLCGSEGTLAVTLGATLKLHERPKAKGLAVIGFGDLDEAIAMVRPILATGPSAVEMLDDMIIGLARKNAEYRRYVDLMPAPTDGRGLRAVLYVEYFGGSEAEITERFEALSRVIASEGGGSVPPVQLYRDAGAMLSAWKLRKAGEPLLHGVPGTRKPITFIEDNAIPVERLGEFVRRLREIVTKHGTIASYWAHASVGVLHVRPLLDIHDEDDRERMRSIAVQSADLARELGGVMSGEHGDGRVRGPLLERFYGSELMGAFKEVKRLFDPSNLLNPGNVVDLSGERPRPIESMTRALRVEPTPGRPVAVPSDVETFYDYEKEHGFDSAVEMCNGAGVCRKKQGGTMCPSYMATLDERHSTRGRGNALRLAITGQLRGEDGESIWSDAGTQETLHLCLSCKACKTECPSNVDIAKLKAEYTAQRYAREGAAWSARVMGNIRTLNMLGSIAPTVANWFNSLRMVRGVVNRALDIHSKRSLPAFSASLRACWNEQDEASRDGEGEKIGRDAPVVALFGDCFTMYNESGIGLAAKRVLEACGYRVMLADAGCCGRAKISLGLLGDAIAQVDETLATLRPVIEDDRVVAVLVAEPSCLSAIKDDWLSLKVRTPRTLREKLAKKSFLPEEFLHMRWDAHPRRAVFRAPAGEVVLHGHCHQKALWGVQSSAEMLRRVVGERLRVLESGCCGMAGSFGYSGDRYELSMKIGEQVLLPAVRGARADACIAAPGTSCRHQIHDGAQREALHPIHLLAQWLDEAPGDVLGG
jgi:FAD/FMN-containing dehydrogenase/Fe-S oxidoreductase